MFYLKVLPGENKDIITSKSYSYSITISILYR